MSKLKEDTTSSVNGMGPVALPNKDVKGSGDYIKTIQDIIKELESDEDEEIELTKEEKEILMNWIKDPESVDINEGFIGRIAGAIGGLAFGKSIGKLIADVLGIKKDSPLYNVLTSRLVGGAIGSALGKKLKI